MNKFPSTVCIGIGIGLVEYCDIPSLGWKVSPTVSATVATNYSLNAFSVAFIPKGMASRFGKTGLFD